MTLENAREAGAVICKYCKREIKPPLRRAATGLCVKCDSERVIQYLLKVMIKEGKS